MEHKVSTKELRQPSDSFTDNTGTQWYRDTQSFLSDAQVTVATYDADDYSSVEEAIGAGALYKIEDTCSPYIAEERADAMMTMARACDHNHQMRVVFGIKVKSTYLVPVSVATTHLVPVIASTPQEALERALERYLRDDDVLVKGDSQGTLDTVVEVNRMYEHYEVKKHYPQQ
jgi:hypothetical protein